MYFKNKIKKLGKLIFTLVGILFFGWLLFKALGEFFKTLPYLIISISGIGLLIFIPYIVHTRLIKKIKNKNLRIITTIITVIVAFVIVIIIRGWIDRHFHYYTPPLDY